MMLYRVMLVDDEEEVIQAIIRKLDWAALGFQVVGHAKNGQDALEMLDTLADIIMTDIKMPFMDGLTLCKNVKERYSNIHVVILSGFDDFEYAREAIKLEAEEYILKPINAKEMEDIFKRLKASIDKERSEKRDIQKLREYYLKSLPVMQEQCLTSLLEGKIEENQIANYLEMYQLELEANYYTTVVLHVDFSDYEKDDYLPFEEQLMLVSVKQYVDEKMRPKWNFKSFLYLGKVVLLVMFEKAEDINTFTDHMDRVCKMTERVIGVSTLAGIGHISESFVTLPNSYESANTVITYLRPHEDSRAVCINELEPNLNHNPIMDMKSIQTIIQQIKVGEKEQLTEAIEDFIVQLKSSNFTYQQFHIVSMEVITELYKLSGSYQLDLQQMLGTDIHIVSDIEKIGTIDRLETILKDTCFAIRNFIRKERQDSTQLLIEKAKTYIQDNYVNSNCTIEAVCDYLNISSCYFSTVFKKETGTTLINYLTDVRMEKAKELLKSTDDKTYVIAEKVGYAEPNYFSYVFKKKFQVSPSVYRTNGAE